MKRIDMEVPVKVTDDLTFTLKTSDDEPDNWSELEGNTDNLKVYNTGLRMMKRNAIKSENNIVPVAKKLVTMKVFPNLEASIDFLLKSKGLK